MFDRRPADVLGTSSFGPRDVPQLGAEDVLWTSPFRTFRIFVLPVKNRNRYVVQGLLLLKNNFFIKSSVFVLSPENPLKVLFRSWTLGPLGDLQGTSLGRCVPAGL